MIQFISSNLAPIMFVGLIFFMLLGFPVAFSLSACGLFFGVVGIELGVLPESLLQALPLRIFGIMQNDTLLAIPFFTLMGLILERSGMAEDLLDTIGQLFGPIRGGLAIAVVLVGALLAATTGVVAASVISMGLISLPIMLRYGYDARLATGVIAASGTLAQIIPPSLVLIVLADQLGRSVGDMYKGAFIPGFILMGLYLSYVIGVAIFKKKWAPALPPEARTIREDNGKSGIPSLLVVTGVSAGLAIWMGENWTRIVAWMNDAKEVTPVATDETIVVSLCAAVSLAFAATWRGYVAGELAIGAGQGLFVPAAATLIANSGRDAALGRATARFTTASTTGRSSAVLVTGLLIAMLLTLEWRVPGVVADWRGVFLITAAPNLALLAVLAWWRPTTPAPSPRLTPGADASPSGPGWIGFIGCAASAIAPVMMIQSIGAWYPLLLTRSAGMTPAHAAMLAGAATLMATPLGQWIGGRWLDRHPSWRRWPVRTVAPALILSGAAIAALGAESAPAAATKAATSSRPTSSPGRRSPGVSRPRARPRRRCCSNCSNASPTTTPWRRWATSRVSGAAGPRAGGTPRSSSSWPWSATMRTARNCSNSIGSGAAPPSGRRRPRRSAGPNRAQPTAASGWA